MPRILELCDDFAERFNYEPTKVAGYARVLREAGLLTSGARGVNAPDAKALDAARILIAMMLRSKLADVVSDVQLVGEFVPGEGETFSAAFSPSNFEAGFAGVIEYLGRYELPDGDISRSSYRRFNTKVVIERDAMICSVEIEDQQPRTRKKHKKEVHFAHPELQRWLSSGPKFDNFPSELVQAFGRYKSGFHEAPSLNRDDLIAVGQIVAGRLPVGWQHP